MADYILIEGDKADFTSAFSSAGITITNPAGDLTTDLKGGGKVSLRGKKVCIDGDEKKVLIAGCLYKTIVHTVEGTGVLTIEALASDQVAKKTKSNGGSVLLKGSTFTAKFDVIMPAQTSTGISAPKIPYTGFGQFVTNNQKWKAV